MPSDAALRIKARESALVEKGLVDPAALDALVDYYSNDVGPRNGARVVARAWLNPEYRAWLFEDATAAIAELGYSGRQGEDMQALANTPEEHNLVVCTLCSCYRSSSWFAAGMVQISALRSRAVIDRVAFWRIWARAAGCDTYSGWDSLRSCAIWLCPCAPRHRGFTEEDSQPCHATMIGTAIALSPTEAEH